MNLTFYVVLIAFIFALFYLCSRESSDEDDVHSTGDGDCANQTSNCNIDIPPHPHNAFDPTLGHQLVPQNICPPSYEQVIGNEEFYSMNKSKFANQSLTNPVN